MALYAAVTCFVALVMAFIAFWYGRWFQRLADLPVPVPARPLPRLSVIVPACNEAPSIRATAESLLRQDYPDLELILVNDRSTDDTGALMDQVAAEHPGRVRVVHIRELPPRWLGKNHANWVGARAASGDWLLFTDGDVLFHPTCMQRAVGHAETEGLDHLVLFPHIRSGSFLLRAFVSYFISVFSTYNMTYLANRPGRSHGTGCGAFNLVRRTAYQAVGTHAAISLRPDDDVRLGRRLKQLGLKQRILSGAGLVWVDWYPSLREAIRGLEKNTFAVADYSLSMMTAMCASLLALDALPFLAVWTTTGWAQGLLLATVLLKAVSYVEANRKSGTLVALGFLLFPLMAAIFVYTCTRATWLAYRQGGVYWRGTLYPLPLLRSQTGLEGS